MRSTDGRCRASRRLNRGRGNDLIGNVAIDEQVGPLVAFTRGRRFIDFRARFEGSIKELSI
jgi:hypothetical protein